MKGENTFTKSESKEIKDHLHACRDAGRDAQKSIRAHLRLKYNFYITDYTSSKKGFTPEDSDHLVQQGEIIIQ